MWCPLNRLVCWLKQGFRLLNPSSSYLVKPLTFPVELSWCQEIQKTVQGEISKPFISGLPVGMHDLRSVDCLVYALLLEFQIISLRNNNKLNSETVQGWKEVVPVLLLRTVFGSHCFGGAEVHCFLAKLNKGKVCVHSFLCPRSLPFSPLFPEGMKWGRAALCTKLFPTRPMQSPMGPFSDPWVYDYAAEWWRSNSEAHSLRVSVALIPWIYHGDKFLGINFWR